MACANCGNDWCTGCTSTLPHVAGDPWDPADEQWKNEKRRQPRAEPTPTPTPRLWTDPCPTCGGSVEIVREYTAQGMITSEFPLTDMIVLRCTGCGHHWEVEE